MLCAIIHAFHAFNVVQTQHGVELLICCAEIVASLPIHTHLCPACHLLHTLSPPPTPSSSSLPPCPPPPSFFPLLTLEVNLAKRVYSQQYLLGVVFPSIYCKVYFSCWKLKETTKNRDNIQHNYTQVLHFLFTPKLDSHLLALRSSLALTPIPKFIKVILARGPNLPADLSLVLL